MLVFFRFVHVYMQGFFLNQLLHDIDGIGVTELKLNEMKEIYQSCLSMCIGTHSLALILSSVSIHAPMVSNWTVL